MKIIRILTALLIIATAGCSLHESRINGKLTDIPSSYSTGEKKPAPPIGKWWEQFEDNKLNLLMQEAFRHNLDIVRAYERLQQSLAVMRKTGSSRGVILNIEGSGGISRLPGISGTSTSGSYTLSAAAAYESDLWGKLESKTRAAQLDALASEQNLKALYISISAELADLYYLAIEQRAQLELSEQTIASFQDTLERVERRYREGLVPAIDVYQSRQNLSTARSRRPLFESGLSVTLNAISVLTGKFPDKKRVGDVNDLQKAPVFPAGLPSQLLKNRPDIRATLLRLKASDERVAAAIADRFPSFNLAGSYGGSGDKIRTILDSPNIFWNILLQIAQPVLDAGRRRAEVDRTEAVFRENLAVYHKTVLNAFREVEDALSRIRASEARIKTLDETVSASENSLRLALDRYMQGLTGYLPVLSGQLQHLAAKSDLIATRRQLISDRIQLARALGGDWVETVFNKETI